MTRMTDHTQMTPPRNTVRHGPEVVRLDTVAPSTVKWLWNQRIALGKLTLIAGDPGLGKSYLTLDLASRVSTGRAMPGDVWENGSPMERFPGTAILLSAEDDPADTIRPRLEAAGADLRRVAMVTGVRTGDTVNSFNLRDHLKFLRGMCKADEAVRLIVIDPISAYLGDEEGHSNTKVRNLLSPLAKLAQDYNVAVVAVTHLNKSGSGGGAQSAIYRAMGSLAFTAAARTVHLVSRDPDDPERRLLVPIKNNLGQDRSGYGFTIGLTGAGDSAVCWEDAPTHETADALLARLSRPSSNAASSPKTDEAVAWLRDRLESGPVSTQELEALASQAGISQRTLKRARSALGVAVAKRGDRWVCSLPDTSQALSLYPAEQ